LLGENLTLLPGKFPQIDIPGGKGCNQAIACSKLSKNSNTVTFLGQFGNDEGASILRSALVENNVNVDLCGISAYPSGRGYVFLEKESGKVGTFVENVIIPYVDMPQIFI
jgi:sugar/nucleoside kinase (ribokinase family)